MPSSACNLIAFFSSYSVSTNSISTLLLQLHSQNSSLLQNQNHNPLSSFFYVCFPSTPQFHQRKIRFFLYLGILAFLWILKPLSSPLLVAELVVAQDKTHHLSWRSNHYRRLSAAKGGRSKRGMEDDKSLSAFHTMWSLKEKDLAGKEKLSKMGLLDRLIAKTEPLSEEEEALKKKLIREMLAN
ncbi:hypothetical protein Bca4012_050383 [Brassica carinata]|uniref:Uncharacterized protein n=1 Tax=Brassica carinata TaxID=52824 RepID=A0A8X7RAZ9_BRACI|nr:hypothetical protein Bca52824_053094 [Brassica carinata]